MTKEQHSGFGKSLLLNAENISKSYGCDRTMVISGLGVRNYYRKIGYEIPYNEKNHGGFLLKKF